MPNEKKRYREGRIQAAGVVSPIPDGQSIGDVVRFHLVFTINDRRPLTDDGGISRIQRLCVVDGRRRRKRQGIDDRITCPFGLARV